MSRMLFVNLPVHDVGRSVRFFTRLGFTFDERFTDDRATCMLVGEQASVMLLVRPFFATFTPRAVADTEAATAAIMGVSARSRDEVDVLVDRALALGGTPANDPSDEGYLYGRSFFDLDGHAWEVIWMDPGAAA